MKNKKTLVILDAHAIIHRAYHALPNFATTSGVPTGALYGVVSMLLKIIETLKPDFIVAAYDLPKPTFRHLAYDEYKAGRAKSDDNLISQIKESRKIFEAFNIPIIDCEGFEADDVIGTLTYQLKEKKDLAIIIASGDMDTMQLVDGERVKVFTLKKGIQDTILYDEKAVVDRFGFLPIQLIDYKGLRGDPSDNITGVPGIGEKTATTLINHFGNIENIYKKLEAGKKDEFKKIGVTDRIIMILEEHKDDAFFSKTLATIRLDTPITYEIPEKTFIENLDLEIIYKVLDEYEFRSLNVRIKNIFSKEEVVFDQSFVDPILLQKASVALWVLYSEYTNPSFETILTRTKTTNLEDAYKLILDELAKRKVLEVYEKIEEPLIPIISEMERNGILIDKAYLDVIRESLTKTINTLEQEIYTLTNSTINLNSPKQLSILLFDTLGLKPKGKKKISGAYTTNIETLESLIDSHPSIPLIIKYRELEKLLNTYVEALPTHIKEDGRIHARFLQHGTTTGRFSSQDPNLQNIPARGDNEVHIRKAFIVPQGSTFVSSDYSQIELRVLAILSEDKKLIESFEQGKDIHNTVASFMFNVSSEQVTADMRRAAKVINFGIIYGMGITALQKNLQVTRVEANDFYQKYFEQFPTIKAYLESVKEGAKEVGFTETMFGRRRYFPGINQGAPFMRSFIERMATNAPIQGSAADIVKIAIILIDKKIKNSDVLKDSAKLVMQIHDELVFEVKNEHKEELKKIIKETMTSVLSNSPISFKGHSVPLEVSLGEGITLDTLK